MAIATGSNETGPPAGWGDVINGVFTITSAHVCFALSGLDTLDVFGGAADLVLGGMGRPVRMALARPAPAADRLCGRIPRRAFGSAGDADWARLTARLEARLQGLALEIAVFAEDPAQPQSGHVAGITREGHLQGWSRKPESGAHELPVTAELDGTRLFVMTGGAWWAQDGSRRFDIPLTRLLRPGRVHGLRVAGGCTRTDPFGRAEGFVVQTEIGLVHGAPVRVDAGRIEGAFQTPEDAGAVLSVTLRQDGRSGESCACTRSGPYDFNGKPCGFALPLPPGFAVGRAEIVLEKEGAGDAVPLALKDFAQSARQGDTERHRDHG